MISDRYTIDGENSTLTTILNKVEAYSLFCGFSKNQAMQNRLLSEEMLSSITDLVEVSLESNFWFVSDDTKLELHAFSQIPCDEEARKKLLFISASGKNTAPKGFFGKVGMLFDKIFSSSSPVDLAQYGLMAPNSADHSISPIVISYADYARRPKTEEELPTIEKSIIENIADDITVTIMSDCFEIVATRNIVAE